MLHSIAVFIDKILHNSAIVFEMNMFNSGRKNVFVSVYFTKAINAGLRSH
jgi:hypothetical protein